MPLKNEDDRYPNNSEHSNEQESVIEAERRRALDESTTNKTYDKSKLKFRNAI